jgi:hypothetical protein
MVHEETGGFQLSQPVHVLLCHRLLTSIFVRLEEELLILSELYLGQESIGVTSMTLPCSVVIQDKVLLGEKASGIVKSLGEELDSSQLLFSPFGSFLFAPVRISADVQSIEHIIDYLPMQLDSRA